MGNNTLDNSVKSLMTGAIDLHLHATSEGKPRRQNMLEVARDASEVGMRAVVCKCRDTCTAEAANLVKTLVQGVEVYGGVVLDCAVGGLNPHAVKACLAMGGKTVWMPSFDSAWTIKMIKERPQGGVNSYKVMTDTRGKGEGISILKGGLSGSELLPEVQEILALVAENAAVIETCHLSPRETLILVEGAKNAGVEHIVITHVNSELSGITIEGQKELARKGAFLMYTFAQCLPSVWRASQPFQTIISMIQQVGVEHCVLATDMGLYNYPPAVEGLRMFITGLLMGGVKEDDLERMVKTNPASLLGLK